MTDPALVTAWATAAVAFVTGVSAAATCFLISRGLLEMRRSSTERAKDRREEAMARHDARSAPRPDRADGAGPGLAVEAAAAPDPVHAGAR